jgi:hypothetical protein
VKRLHLMLAVTAAVVASIAGVTGARADSQGKAQVCHGTASDTNPFVLIDVSVNAVPAQIALTDSRMQSFVFDPTRFASCWDQFLANYSL